jgi:hypothetical protein
MAEDIGAPLAVSSNIRLARAALNASRCASSVWLSVETRA